MNSWFEKVPGLHYIESKAQDSLAVLGLDSALQ